MNDTKRMKRNKILIVIMFIIGIIGLGFISYDYILSKIRLTFDTVNLELYGNDIPKEVKENSKEEKEIVKNNNNILNSSNTNTNNSKKVNYFAYLDIPKINLKQGLVPIESKYNNVDMNILIVNPSDYPDVQSGNLILAAHSGTSSISYFKNLYKLKTNDKVNIIYNSYKYVYNIVNIYKVPKNGNVEIYRDKNKTTITLITCTKNDDNSQTVYIGEQIRKEGI